MAGLLNPAVEASVCRRMLDHLDDQLKLCERQMAVSLMEREQYLQTFGRAAALRAALADLKMIYDQNFHT